MSDNELAQDVAIGQTWTTYRRADGDLIWGDYTFMTGTEWTDECDEPIAVCIEVWQLVSREVQMMGPQPEPDDEEQDER